jgi:hypothetical protein
MARDIRITPKLNSTTTNDFPEIQFGGLSSSTIKLKVDDDGSVVYTGTYGVLFNVTDEKNGLLHSVNDISGLPILQVYSWDYVQMGKWDKYSLTVNSDKVGVGLTAPSTKFHIYSTQSGAFRLQDGTQGAGYVLQSDVNGVGTWTASTQGVSGITVSGTANVYTKFTGTGSTIGDTQYDIHESSIGSSGMGSALSFGPSTDTDPISYGQIAHAKDNISQKGDAQTNQIILKASVSSGSVGELYSELGSNISGLLIPVNGVIGFEMQLVAMEVSGDHRSTFTTLLGTAKNTAASPQLIGWDYYSTPDFNGTHSNTPNISIFEQNTQNVIHTINNISVSGTGTSSYLKIEVEVDRDAEPSNFVAYVRYTQTIF